MSRRKKPDWRALALEIAINAEVLELREGKRYLRCAVCGRFIKIADLTFNTIGHKRYCPVAKVLRAGQNA